jgi:hypothetical protein
VAQATSSEYCLYEFKEIFYHFLNSMWETNMYEVLQDYGRVIYNQGDSFHINWKVM